MAGAVSLGANPGSGIFNRTLGTLNLSSGGSAALALPSGSGNRTVLVLGGLQFSGSSDAWQGLLDLSANDLVVDSSSQAVIADQIKQGFDGGSWSGTGGITSSEAAVKPLMCLGYMTGGGSFDGLSTTSSDVLVKYTYYGDANLDGKVDGSDYSLIDSGYLTQASGWFNGDFNYDGLINGSDYTLIDNAFNMQGAALTAEFAAPTYKMLAVQSLCRNLPHCLQHACSLASSRRKTIQIKYENAE